MWFTAGPGIPQHGTQQAGAVGVFILPQSDFQFDGQIIKFEFYANATGTINFLVRSDYRYQQLAMCIIAQNNVLALTYRVHVVKMWNNPPVDIVDLASIAACHINT